MENEVMKRIKWLGHSGFIISGGDKIVVIDPYEIQCCFQADIILITHPHYDHCSIEDIVKIRKVDTVFITEAESAKSILGDVRVVKPGDKLTVDGVLIEAVPAYNANKEFHPQKNDWLGFTVTIEDASIYHAGDTGLIPEMEAISADIALLPISGTYVMNAEEAIQAAIRLNAEVTIPMHYDPRLDRKWKIFPGVGTKEDELKFGNGLESILNIAVLPRWKSTHLSRCIAD